MLSRFLHVVCTCFYDDLPTLSSQFWVRPSIEAYEFGVNLLGWDHAQVGVKAADFASEFAALGRTAKLQELHLGSSTLANKEGRIPKIVEMLSKLRSQSKVSRNEPAEIQGHLNLPQGFFTSRSLKLICQIELFAYLAARFEYRDLLHNKGVIAVAWLDNEAARSTASKGSTQAQTSTAMARVIQHLEIDYPTVMWVETVCSYSNPSDKASRGKGTTAAKLCGATHDQRPIKLGGKILQSVEALSHDLLTAVGYLFPK